MFVRVNHRDSAGVIDCTMPAPDLQPRELQPAARLFLDASARSKEAVATVANHRAARAQAAADIEAQAREADLKTGKVPKGLAKALRAADEALEEAEIEKTARRSTLTVRAAEYSAALVAHRAKVEEHALKLANESLGHLSRAYEALEAAQTVGRRGFGALGMYENAARTGTAPRGVWGDRFGSRRAGDVSNALQYLAQAIASTKAEIERAEKQAEQPEPVVEPVDPGAENARMIQQARAERKAAALEVTIEADEEGEGD